MPQKKNGSWSNAAKLQDVTTLYSYYATTAQID